MGLLELLRKWGTSSEPGVGFDSVLGCDVIRSIARQILERLVDWVFI